MCPACMASAALMAGGVITSGGLAALVGKVLYPRQEKTNDSDNSSKRSNHYGYGDGQDGTFEGRVSS